MLIAKTIEDADALLFKVKPEEAAAAAAAQKEEEKEEEKEKETKKNVGDGGEGAEGSGPSGTIQHEGSGSDDVLDDAFFKDCKSLPPALHSLPVPSPTRNDLAKAQVV